MTLVDRYAAELAAVIRELNSPAHEPVLRTAPVRLDYGHRNGIGLSCLCLAVPQRGRPRWDWIDVRSPFPAADAIAEWRAWHERAGITL